MATTVRRIGKVTGAAMTTAPYVRRVATDEELRSDIQSLLRSVSKLYREIAQDKRIRSEVRSLAEALQDGTDRLRRDVTPRRSRLGRVLIGTGAVLGMLAIIAAFAYPRSRQSMTRLASETRQRASSTVQDVRGRFSSSDGMEQAA